FLPYVLRWNFRVTDSKRPDGFAIEAWGGLTGHGCWTFTQNGPDTDVAYEWSVRADKPLLKYFSFLLRPLFALNHNWVMDRGREGLLRELAASM
ncbi:MAG TPA: polyketide cyclase, partial [Candidatus Peribacteria bacterium]|nr:polyketide cyclase [Candidatus Peribacteria bacterium]